jgi:hypothetical protein
MSPIEKIDSFYFRWLPLSLTMVILAVLPTRLAMMQTSGCLTTGAAFVTSLFGVTSLLYARARAVADPEETKARATIADECLKLTLLALMGFAITSFCFLSLSEGHQERVGHVLNPKTPPEIEPAITASLCAFFFFVPIVVKMRFVIELTVANLGLGPKDSSKTVHVRAESRPD